MGREIRMVPPNWAHPKTSKPNHRLGRMEEVYQPIFDRDLQSQFDEWLEEYRQWIATERAKIVAKGKYDYPADEPYRTFCEYHGQPPDPEYYRPKWLEGTATWFQVYETVSEGTPVSPPFATREELVDYLVANGDFWDQSRRREGRTSMNCDPWTREQAERFVFGTGWAPSLVVTHTAEGTQIASGTRANI